MTPAPARASQQAAPRASFVEIARDVAAMKRMSIPIVAELGRCVGGRPTPDMLAGALDEQLADEHRHVALCEAAHVGRDGYVSPPAPRYVAAFARAVALFARGTGRSYVLWVATVLCTAVETVALAQLARAAADPRWRELFDVLSRDEARHFRLVAGPAAERLAGLRVPRAQLRAQALLLAFAVIALGWWWPTRLAAYRCAGLDVNEFLRALGDEVRPVLERAGVFFPRRVFVTGARIWLWICGRLAGRSQPGTKTSRDHE